MSLLKLCDIRKERLKAVFGKKEEKKKDFQEYLEKDKK